MQAPDDEIAAVVSALADGRGVDWPAVLSRARNETDLGILHQLRTLADIHSGASGSGVPSGQWGPLQLFEELGHGAYGHVYRARDTRLERDVALKLFPSGPGTEGRFLREAQALARIRHPHIVSIHGAEVFDGVPGIWMELVRGRTLETIVREQGPFDPREAALVGMDLCAAIAAVHAGGLLHRDIKAHNVMREVGGRIVLMDFGTGRPSDATNDLPDASVTGTPMYMAPELFAGAPASVATDLYALGVLLFFLVTGEYPVAGANVPQLHDAHGRGSRRSLREVRPAVSGRFAEVIDRALRPDAAHRFASAIEMERALAAALHAGERSEHAANASPGGRRAAWIARPLPAWALIAALGLTIPAAFGIGSWTTSRQQPALPATTDDVPEKPVSLTPQQWEIIETQEELAGMLGERGEWAQAVERYTKISELLYSRGWGDEPFRSHIRGKLAWAQLRAGQLDAASKTLAIALYMLEQEGGRTHPLRATLLMSTAELQYAKGDRRAAAASVAEAVGIRIEGLAAAGCTPASTSALDVRRLEAGLAHGSPGSDQDGDWIPDVIERSVGLDPTRADTDQDGLKDDEEDSRGDGLVNGLAWALVPDASRVQAHFGSIDPERAGYRRERPFTAGPSVLADGRRAWHVTAATQGHYYQRLTSAQKHRAVNGGFRLLSCGVLSSGVTGVDVDVTPLGPRYDQTFVMGADRRVSLLLATRVMPREGEYLKLDGSGRWPATEFVLDPGQGIRVNAGKFRRAGFTGHTQYQEDYGLFFSATNDIGAAPRGEVDFSLILMQIR